MAGKSNSLAAGECASRPLPVTVECYAGYRGEETPRRFHLGRRRVEVLEVSDRWLAPDHRYFKLRGDDGGRYILRHDGKSGTWEVVFFAVAGEGEPAASREGEP